MISSDFRSALKSIYSYKIIPVDQHLNFSTITGGDLKHGDIVLKSGLVLLYDIFQLTEPFSAHLTKIYYDKK